MPGNIDVFGVHSGFVNVCSMTGRRLWDLEIQTLAFGSYEFGEPPSPEIPEADWKSIVASYFPGCDVFSFKEMVKRTHYSDWRSMVRAITACRSGVHFFRDGPVWATKINSFDFGIAKVIGMRAEREAATTAVSSGSAIVRKR